MTEYSAYSVIGMIRPKEFVSENIVREGSNGYEVIRKVLEDVALPKYLGTKKRTIDDVDNVVVEKKEGSNSGIPSRNGDRRKADPVNRQHKKNKVSASEISLAIDVDNVVEKKEGSNLGNARGDGVKRKADLVNRQHKKVKVSATEMSLAV